MSFRIKNTFYRLFLVLAAMVMLGITTVYAMPVYRADNILNVCELL